MIHDYFLSKMENKLFTDVKNQEKYKKWLEKEYIIPIGCSKKENQDKITEDNKHEICKFYPSHNDIIYLPEQSTLIKFSFTLKKPYMSKDESEFNMIDGRKLENPIVRDKFTALPIVRPSTWKGHLRFAAERVDWNDKNKKKEIIKRLFGQENHSEEDTLKGRLHFFTTFFKKESDRDIITPLKRDTRTPADNSPISLEVIKPGKNGIFYLLYFPYPKDDKYSDDEAKEDMEFLTEALKLMFYVYGFSAKKTSGYGVIQEKIENGEIWIKKASGCNTVKFIDLNKLGTKIKALFDDKEGVNNG